MAEALDGVRGRRSRRGPITYRTIDFRTNEFRGLEGGERFEPEEANPMIGFRGALRYTREPELFAPRARRDRAACGTRATATCT